MTQIFTEEGVCEPVTILVASPAVVTQVKTKEKDGYEAVQLSAGTRRKISRPLAGHFGDLGSFRHTKEYRNSALKEYPEKGTVIDISSFEEGEKVTVTAVSKGKGFQGVVKRHGFHGGPRTHGQKHSEREPGSIGGGLRTRVPKGMRMAGRMGGDTITVKNLKVLKIDKESGQILLGGAVPGTRGSLVEIKGKENK